MFTETMRDLFIRISHSLTEICLTLICKFAKVLLPCLLLGSLSAYSQTLTFTAPDSTRGSVATCPGTFGCSNTYSSNDNFAGNASTIPFYVVAGTGFVAGHEYRVDFQYAGKHTLSQRTLAFKFWVLGTSYNGNPVSATRYTIGSISTQISTAPTNFTSGSITFFANSTAPQLQFVADSSGEATAILAGFTVVDTGRIGINSVATTTAQNLVTNSAASSFVPLVASDGTAPYTYLVKSGTLPPGLTLNSSTGAVTGTPTTLRAAANVVFSVKDANNYESLTTSTVSCASTCSYLIDTH
jgi:hypothetical protein